MARIKTWFRFCDHHQPFPNSRFKAMNPIVRTALRFDLDLINQNHPFPIHDLEPRTKPIEFIEFWFRFHWTTMRWRREKERDKETHPSKRYPYPCPNPFSRLKPIPKRTRFIAFLNFFNHALSDRWERREGWMTGSGAKPGCHLTVGVIYGMKAGLTES